ncbi:MAG: trimethylamine methyltransferase family protein [Desulfobacterales bacterium]|nr:trimethylamine methyltransferase family protein [Desulfobacterales bacterium]
MGIATENLYFKPSLRVINDEQISLIHSATLEVLERTGVKMTHHRGLETLEGAGARVTDSRIRIPSCMVKAGGKKFEDRLQSLTLKKMEHKPRQLSKEIIKELDKMQASWK